MSQNKVFEGRAELDIKPFLDALEELKQRTTASVSEMATLLKQLDASITSAAQNVKSSVQQIAQQITSAGKTILSANNQLQKGASVSAAQRAQENAWRVQLAREIEALKNAGNEKARIFHQQMQQIISMAKYAGAQQLALYEKQLRQENNLLAQALKDKRELQAKARQEQIDALSSLSNALLAGDAQLIENAKNAYRAATREARLAAEEQKVLQKQLTEVVRATEAVQKVTMQRQLEELKEFTHLQAFYGKTTIKEQFTAIQEELKRVEDRWNSIYRAGTQLSSLGNQFIQFAQQIGQVGFALTTNAGDFDFWVARTRAAMQAAGSNETVTSVEMLRDRILTLGRDLGSLNPEQLAEGWFTYQAALGTTIRSVEDLNVAQEALNTMLRAGIISASDPATVMRGVAGVLAAYRLETDQAAYATSVLMNVTQRTQAEFGDLLEAYKMVGSNAAVMNANIAETSTLLALMAEQNIKGSQAGRALNMAYSRLLDPTKEANDALQEIFVTSQGLTGSWKDVVFAGGSFIGMLGELDAQGNVIKQGFIEKFVQPFMELPKAMRDTALGEAIGKIFPENAARGILPIMTRYADALEQVRLRGADAKNEILQMYAEFANGATQASLFEQQWATVSDSVRIRFDKALYGLQEAFTRLGIIAAKAFTPVIETISAIAIRIAEWAEKNPELATTIMTVVGGIAAFAAVVGPVLISLGFLLQTITSLAVTKTALTGAINLLGNAFSRLIPTITSIATGAFPTLIAALGSISAPMWALIALLGLLAAAWYTNWNGVGDFMNGLVGLIFNAFQSIGDIIGGIMGIIIGLVTGNNQQVQASFEQLGTAIIELLLAIPLEIGNLFSTLAGNLQVWGYNMMISLANGIAEAAQAVIANVGWVAGEIAKFFQSYSPPRFGPLRGIYEWGRNLIQTYIEGMNTADIEAVSTIAGRIKEGLQLAGIADNGETYLQANELAAQMISMLQKGERVNATFFEQLRKGLGAWYDDIVAILLAYQEMYATERALNNEQKKLALIREQRKELEKQQQLRENAFDAYLSANSVETFDSTATQLLVDPTTKEGKAKIEEMRRVLSTEEFQNWINYQKRLWEQKTKAEDQALAVQEDAAQAAVDAYTKQLDIVKTQYAYLVKMYEYAKGLMETTKTKYEQQSQQRSRSGGGGGGASTRREEANAGVEEARRRIREIVGADQAIYDEQQLQQQRGGDAMAALETAVEQKRREQSRLEALEDEHRRRRAKFETDLINATSEEERRRIREQMDAWEIAYREEKARLTERKNLTEEITKAADQQAALGENARIQEQRALAETAIAEAMQGQLETTTDLQQEEQELQALRDLGERKRIEFERRLREAQGNEAAIRRIKEEQRAWEEAYNAALQAQQEKVEGLQRIREETARVSGGTGGGLGGGYSIPEFTGLPTLPALKDQTPFAVQPAERIEDKAIRPTLQKARELWEDFKRGWNFITDQHIDFSVKVQALWETIKQTFKLDELGASIAQGWENIVVKPAANLWNSFMTSLQNGWNTYVVQPIAGWWSGIISTLDGWRVGIIQFFANLGTAFVDWISTYLFNPVITGWNATWNFLTQKWNEFSTATIAGWNAFWTWLGQAWEAFASSVTTGWDQFWRGLAQGWESFKQAVIYGWAAFWAALQGAWNAFAAAVVAGWSQMWATLASLWEAFKATVIERWGQFWDMLVQRWTEFTDDLVTLWEAFTALFTGDWDGFWDRILTIWDDFVASFEPITDTFNRALNSIKETIQRIIGGLSSWGGATGSEAYNESAVDGSFAEGLYRVPFDGFIAELHRGERVLTAAEAATYNQLEASGLLEVLTSLIHRASSAVDLATNVTTTDNRSTVTQINEHTTTSRVTNISIGKVENTTPSSARAFLQQLSFLG